MSIYSSGERLEFALKSHSLKLTERQFYLKLQSVCWEKQTFNL